MLLSAAHFAQIRFWNAVGNDAECWRNESAFSNQIVWNLILGYKTVQNGIHCYGDGYSVQELAQKTLLNFVWSNWSKWIDLKINAENSFGQQKQSKWKWIPFIFKMCSINSGKLCKAFPKYFLTHLPIAIHAPEWSAQSIANGCMDARACIIPINSTKA